MPSRRDFLAHSGTLSLGLLGAAPVVEAAAEAPDGVTEEISLCGTWLFRTDGGDVGESSRWYGEETGAEGWRRVTVPHTWQIEPGLTDYRGRAWYRRRFEARKEWRGSAVRVEFEAVFHSARVWVNGSLAGEHLRKGYTAFTFDIGHLIEWDRPNTIAVWVDNAFDENMLPRGRSSDWAHDGGIFRPVRLLITPEVFFERVAIDTFPDFRAGRARVEVAAHARNASGRTWKGAVGARIVDEETGLEVFSNGAAAELEIAGGAAAEVKFSGAIERVKLWHFDHPRLYTLEVSFSDGHRLASTFGVRKFETNNEGLYLNGERVRLMGVERMAGSNPEYGMAEPEDWIRHDHADLKNLNCVFTRVHWAQDRRVLDYCDRHGILIQTEVPAWGPDTFAGMTGPPSEAILENGLEQLREMIAGDRNHPSICSWGVCNEINGQNPPAYGFAKRLYEEAKRLDPERMVSYASNSLFHTPGRDVAGLMDFVMMNEYYGSWQKGTAADLGKTLDQIHAAFPGKAVVISEYGYCACTAERPEGDQRREETLIEQDEVFRERNYIAGAIFFCYNDYRTHVGDRGIGVMQQRVHGVVDLYGERKGSYDALRRDSSPIERLHVEGSPKELKVNVRARAHLPAYTLRGYKLRGVYYGPGDIPVERQEAALPALAPGESVPLALRFAGNAPERIELDVLRPTGMPAYSLTWKL